MNCKPRLLRVVFCFALGILLVSCVKAPAAQKTGPDAPASQKTQPVQAAAQPEGGSKINSLLADPIMGLDQLEGYRASLRQDILGTLDGQPYERHVRVELSRQPASGDYDYVNEVASSDAKPAMIKMVALGKAYYRWPTAESACQGSTGAPVEGTLVEPASLLLPVRSAEMAGKEIVNGIPAAHYRFDQDSLPITKNAYQVSGEVWIADPGGYVVKYLLNAAQPGKITGKGLEASQTWTYEVNRLKAGQGIELPEGCEAVPMEVPALEGAHNVTYSGGRLNFTSTASSQQIVDFYMKELPALGWALSTKISGGELPARILLEFTRKNQHLTLYHTENDEGSRDTDLLISNIQEVAPAAQQQATETPAGEPTSAPTIDPATSGLPEDIPLYPGAIGLMKTNEIIMFSSTDALNEVAGFYRKQMPENGWTLQSESSPSGTVILFWQKKSVTKIITLVAVDKLTQVVITTQQ